MMRSGTAAAAVRPAIKTDAQPDALVSARHSRVTYWTGWLSPEMEGCSREVFALRQHFDHSRLVGLSQHYVLKAFRADRYLGINVRGYPLLRLAAPALEWASDINHIYGGLRDWFFLRMLRRRPLVVTPATSAWPLDRALYKHVD